MERNVECSWTTTLIWKKIHRDVLTISNMVINKNHAHSLNHQPMDHRYQV